MIPATTTGHFTTRYMKEHPTASNNIQQHPTTSNNTQQHPTTLNNTQQHPTTPNNTQQHPTTYVCVAPKLFLNSPHQPHNQIPCRTNSTSMWRGATAMTYICLTVLVLYLVWLAFCAVATQYAPFMMRCCWWKWHKRCIGCMVCWNAIHGVLDAWCVGCMVYCMHGVLDAWCIGMALKDSLKQESTERNGEHFGLKSWDDVLWGK